MSESLNNKNNNIVLKSDENNDKINTKNKVTRTIIDKSIKKTNYYNTIVNI